MAYNLTPSQKELLREIVARIRSGKLEEEFKIVSSLSGQLIPSATGYTPADEFTTGKLEALAAVGFIHLSSEKHGVRITLTGSAYEAVDDDFNSPDTSFLTQLTPLADVTNLDTDLKQRVLPILGAGASDPMLWDSAVRTASVVLEERLRDIGQISDGSIGKKLVNSIFSAHGSLAAKFAQDAERESYRDLYAGVVGLVRNPSAHRLIDPTPEEGGVLIVLVNLLLSKLEALR